MQELQNFIDDPKKYGASQLGTGAFAFIFGLSMMTRISQYGMNDIIESLVYSGCAGLGAWGIVFMVSYTFIHMLPGIILILNPEAAKEMSKKQVKVNQPILIEDVHNEDDDPDFWLKNLEKHILPNRMFRVRNQQRLLDANFNTDWLYFLAETKWEGDLPHVSANYLHQYTGISRFGDGKTPADLVIEFLESFNLITKNGQVYQWTILGNEVFPTSPTLD